MILEPRGCSWSGFRGWVGTQDLGFLLRVSVVFCLVTFWTFPPREVNFPGADHFLISHLPQAFVQRHDLALDHAHDSTVLPQLRI